MSPRRDLVAQPGLADQPGFDGGLAEVEELARQRLPTDVWDFVAGGSGREQTLAGNASAWDAVRIVPRVLRDVSDCDTKVTIFGCTFAMPVVVAPIAYHRLVHPEGELATAHAAREAGVPLTVSTLSSETIEAIASTGVATWFQLYWLRDSSSRVTLIRRAEQAGCEALVVTVDVPWMGRRLRDVRNRFAPPTSVVAANLSDAAQVNRTRLKGSGVAAHTADIVSPSLDWADIEALCAETDLPVVIKGILDADDARRAIQAGVKGIVVSNHGGRQLDGAAASVDCLSGVVKAVGGQCVVLVDSGIRSGTDVLKALALGADAVLVGRPVMWGLGAGGSHGVRYVLNALNSEMRDSLGLAGCASVADAHALRTISSRSGWT